MHRWCTLLVTVGLFIACQADEVDRCEFCSVDLMKTDREYFQCSWNQVDCLSGLAEAAAKVNFTTVQPHKVEYHMMATSEDQGEPWKMYSIIYECCDDVPCDLTQPAGDKLDPSVAGCMKCTKNFIPGGYYFWQCEYLGQEGCPVAFARRRVDSDFAPCPNEIEKQVSQYCLLVPGKNEGELLPFCTYGSAK
ncbi:uncharacterized protein [Ptychodera flava]|uniref:uncharacterized protein n=1 Tax=Ptychodera flava TaxID=63121 RepID=UPI003969C024